MIAAEGFRLCGPMSDTFGYAAGAVFVGFLLGLLFAALASGRPR